MQNGTNGSHPMGTLRRGTLSDLSIPYSLASAIEMDNKAALQSYLQQLGTGVDGTIPERDNMSYVLYAFRCQSIETLIYLIENGAKLDHAQGNLLIEFSVKKNSDFSNFLLKRLRDIHAKPMGEANGFVKCVRSFTEQVATSLNGYSTDSVAALDLLQKDYHTKYDLILGDLCHGLHHTQNNCKIHFDSDYIKKVMVGLLYHCPPQETVNLLATAFKNFTPYQKLVSLYLIYLIAEYENFYTCATLTRVSYEDFFRNHFEPEEVLLVENLRNVLALKAKYSLPLLEVYAQLQGILTRKGFLKTKYALEHELRTAIASENSDDLRSVAKLLAHEIRVLSHLYYREINCVNFKDSPSSSSSKTKRDIQKPLQHKELQARRIKKVLEFKCTEPPVVEPVQYGSRLVREKVEGNVYQSAKTFYKELDMKLPYILTQWLVNTPISAQRVNLLSCYLYCIDHLLDNVSPDHGGAMLMMQVLTSRPVARLDQTFEQLPQALQRKFEEFKEILNVNFGYEKLKSMMKANPNAIPYPLINSQNLAMTASGNGGFHIYSVQGHILLSIMACKSKAREDFNSSITDLATVIRATKYSRSKEEKLYDAACAFDPPMPNLVEGPMLHVVNKFIKFRTLQLDVGRSDFVLMFGYDNQKPRQPIYAYNEKALKKLCKVLKDKIINREDRNPAINVMQSACIALQKTKSTASRHHYINPLYYLAPMLNQPPSAPIVILAPIPVHVPAVLMSANPKGSQIPRSESAPLTTGSRLSRLILRTDSKRKISPPP